MMMKIKGELVQIPDKLTGRRVIQVMPLDYLNSDHAQRHHRLEVFAFKGVRCVVPDCPCEGAFIAVTAEGQETTRGLHYDLYTADFKLMTVDHHVAKVNGGGDHLANKFPMCEKHNSRKGQLSPEIFYERVGKL
jgi:hypothetical protein